MDTNGDQLTQVLEELRTLFRNRRRWLLFFGTGTSCALDPEFGMTALKNHLLKQADITSNTDFTPMIADLEKDKNLGLEQAMLKLPGSLSESSKNLLRKHVGNFVASVDMKHRDPILTKAEQWVGSGLVQKLFEGCPPRHPGLTIITSNYDMLIEYSCSVLGIRLATGFSGGILRKWDWKAVQDSLFLFSVDKRTRSVKSPLPRVELLKLHGSINRFRLNGIKYECDLWAAEVPGSDSVERELAVPGTLKYEQTVQTPDMEKRNRAIQEAEGFLIAGYGFQDEHLHESILSRVTTESCPLVVLTKQLDHDKIKTLRHTGDSVWILVSDQGDTLIYSPLAAEPIRISKTELWACNTFSETILGA
jgi:hypothetical protein